MNNYFERIIGYDHVKKELELILDVMKDKERYQALGASIPKNILLHGEPGVGKTLFAKCFIEASGRKSYVVRKNKSNGEFVTEMNKVFEEAKQNEPSIILLDDLDKFSNGDRNQQFCEEYIVVQSLIDDVKDRDIFVFATCNNMSKLPRSLYRKGRFDRVLEIEPAVGVDSKEIIYYYLKSKKLDKNVNMEVLTRLLEGCTCADIESIINSAACYSGFKNNEFIQFDDIVKTIIYRKANRFSFRANIKKREDTKIIAYHEAGHVVVNEILNPGTLKYVMLDWCLPRPDGHTSCTDCDENRNDCRFDLDNYKKRIVRVLAGKAAIDVLFAKEDVGCRSDIHTANSLAERIIEDFSICGFENFEREQSSEQLLSRKENAITNQINTCYSIAKKILNDNRELLEKVAEELWEKDYLVYTDIDRIKKSCTSFTGDKNYI